MKKDLKEMIEHAEVLLNDSPSYTNDPNLWASVRSLITIAEVACGIEETSKKALKKCHVLLTVANEDIYEDSSVYGVYISEAAAKEAAKKLQEEGRKTKLIYSIVE